MSEAEINEDHWPDATEGRPNPGGMVCHHVVPLLVYERSFEHLEDLLAPGSLGNALDQARHDAPISEIYASIPEAVKRANAMLSHEQDHLRRQFGTTYGQLIAYLHWQVPPLTAASVNAGLSAGDLKLPLALQHPLYKDAVEAVEHAMALGDGGRSSFLAESALELIACLEKPDERCRGPLAEVTILQIAEAGYFGAGSSYEPSSSGDWEWLRENRAPGGGLHLLEMFAVLEEYSWLSQFAGSASDLSARIRNSQTYGLGFHAAKSILEGYHDDGVLRDRFIGDCYRIAPVEFYAAADLALWIPFTPVPEALPGRRLTLSEINPWHRYLTLLDLWEEMDWPCTSITAENARSRFDDFQRECATLLGWDLPVTLARIWRDYLKARTWQLDGFHSAPLQHESFQQSQLLMDLRIQDGFSVAINDLDWNEHAEEFSGERFRAWACMESEGLDLRPVQDGGPQTIHDWLLLTGCRHLVGGNSLNARNLTQEWKDVLVDVVCNTFKQDQSGFDRTTLEPALRRLLMSKFGGL